MSIFTENKLKWISWLAIMTALSAIGAAIKFPAIVGSVALDAFPAILATGIMGGVAGAIVAAMGHFISAMLGGFPLGPMHILIAAEMFVLVWLFGVMYQKGKKFLAAFIFILGNAFIAPLPFILLISKGFYMEIVPSLFIASIINTVIAMAVIPKMGAIFSRYKVKEEVK